MAGEQHCVLRSRLAVASARFDAAGEVQLVWELHNVSPQPIFLFRDRFDPAEYVQVPDHPLAGVTLRVTCAGQRVENAVSEGGPIGIAGPPRRSHYESLEPGEAYRFVFEGLEYTSFSSAEPFRHRTHHWLPVAGELTAEVDYVADVNDPDLQLAAWTGRIRSNQVAFRIG